MPLTKTQKAPSVAAQHGPSMARDASLKAYAPIASGFTASGLVRFQQRFCMADDILNRETKLVEQLIGWR